MTIVEMLRLTRNSINNEFTFIVKDGLSKNEMKKYGGQLMNMIMTVLRNNNPEMIFHYLESFFVLFRLDLSSKILLLIRII